MKTVKKPWGSFTTYALNEKCTVKILKVKKNGVLSLQKHKKRREIWIPLDEGAIIQIGKKKRKAIIGKKHFIPKGTIHRLIAEKNIRVLEISYGKFDEKDIERIEDKYGRVKKK
jgi:mannose-6-phosphate isomerase-like protein (cupin superfamily)